MCDKAGKQRIGSKKVEPHPFASEQNSLEAAYIVEIVSLECTSIRIDSSNFALETAPKKYIIDCQN